MKFEITLANARKLDRQDSVRSYRSQFHLPKESGKTLIYLCGNSLGLQPKATATLIKEELGDWASLGVEGHVHAKRPWMYYHKFTKKALAGIVGAKTSEVVAMNQLTVNLHLMMVSFYRPTAKRFKIIAEAGAFSSDQYVFESQIKFHGFDPSSALVEIKPRDGEFTLRKEDILSTIAAHGDQTALVIFGGVQYYTGQFFPVREIVKAAHDVGAYAALDLAHAVGNVPLQLHKDEVDFAVWCTYKYLNSGPGAIAGVFVHEKHSALMPRFAGWWGHNEDERFQMKKGFKPMPGVDGWQLSNVPVLSCAAHLASLQLFQEIGMKALRKKSELLTGFLYQGLREIDPEEKSMTIITPADPRQRGCQLSIFMKNDGKKIYNKLAKGGVVADWREPGVIRVAPAPLYNSFEEVFRFLEILRKAIPA